jgi:hypothetical protein
MEIQAGLAIAIPAKAVCARSTKGLLTKFFKNLLCLIKELYVFP